MKVVVTRPEPGASRTAQILRERGHEPILMPLSRAVDLQPDRVKLAANHTGAYAVTSSNAIRSWFALGIEPSCLERPLYAVGDRTGNTARQAGFADVRTGGGDGAGLAGKIISDVDSGNLLLSTDARLTYVAGTVRHSHFESALAARKAPVSVVEIYKIENISYSTDFIFRLFSANAPDAVLLYSRKAAERFFDVSKGDDICKLLKSSRFLCISKNVSDAVPEQFGQQTAIAASPKEENLLALLDRSDNLF
ncbi:uroporphyrinogen-III synthase [Hoeflea sp. TYP-13]|uniref:uroporphyrinogen-III synthase n=1 Tax=Hoeflea sp. TYP-13 TaxID=3230023 RepID=UPI0034C62790